MSELNKTWICAHACSCRPGCLNFPPFLTRAWPETKTWHALRHLLINRTLYTGRMRARGGDRRRRGPPSVKKPGRRAARTHGARWRARCTGRKRTSARPVRRLVRVGSCVLCGDGDAGRSTTAAGLATAHVGRHVPGPDPSSPAPAVMAPSLQLQPAGSLARSLPDVRGTARFVITAS